MQKSLGAFKRGVSAPGSDGRGSRNITVKTTRKHKTVFTQHNSENVGLREAVRRRWVGREGTEGEESGDGA